MRSLVTVADHFDGFYREAGLNCINNCDYNNDVNDHVNIDKAYLIILHLSFTFQQLAIRHGDVNKC